jgi:DNA-binding LytR/AlgR family response regulator
MSLSPVPLRVLIVDDEPPARERLRHLLEKIGGVKIVGEATDGKEAVRSIETLGPDVVLMDIQMPGLDGMRVLEALDDPPAVIFSTAYDRYAVPAFDLEAVDYLLKPYSAQRLERALQRARKLLQGARGTGSEQRIPALHGRTTLLVPPGQIVFLSIEESVVFLIREDGEKLICEMNLRDLEEALPASSFFRVSRQSIVNLAAIEGLTPLPEGCLELKMKGGRRVEVSRRRARHLRPLIEK